MIIQPLVDLAELCVRRGIRHAVICPGSRSAAVTLAFARHPEIEATVIPDERSAGYVALGMAQQLNAPVVLICTSGTAALNFAPAVAEAHFLSIPLLVLTADRPMEWIDQQDGQMIHQNRIYGSHVKESYTFPADYTHDATQWFVTRITNQVINTAMDHPRGPVHLNIPIREPFYPTKDEVFSYGDPRIIESKSGTAVLDTDTWEEILTTIEAHDRVLILAGQHFPDTNLRSVLKQLQEECMIPVAGDILSNLGEAFALHTDSFLNSANTEFLENLQPTVLITFGDSFISKNLKIFLRTYKPTHHWHLTFRKEIIDPFQSVTLQLAVEPSYFFQHLLESLDIRAFRSGDEDRDSEYLRLWEWAERKSVQHTHQFFDTEERWGEFKAVSTVMKSIPADSHLHLANSMSVRYANFIGVSSDVTVYSNRGTSGIDGCVSTAVGGAMLTDQLVFLLIGDVAFFYDRNGLWHPHVPNNLRIVLINNSGGSIFRMIEGPRQQPELPEFFETRHQTTAKNTADDARMEYIGVTNEKELAAALETFVKPGEKSKILEINTLPEINQQIFDQFRHLLKHQFVKDN